LAWGGVGGAIVAALLIISFSLFPSLRPLINRFFDSVDVFGFWLSLRITRWFFPEDLGYRFMLPIADFFDGVLVLATSLQCAILGFALGIIVDCLRARRRRRSASR